ncbi:MAG: metal-dependent transcriptional regulator [Lachnospiraceae bacterium]|jgi:Mn-dependent DtxR family transcriptional regulator|nr:metal-dependent transcriptional regulator [Lachnospiraceae bacterium]
MVLHESAEDYLEKILMLTQRNGQVRSIDIATEMGYSKPSISIAMKKLRESGYIEMSEVGLITLTESGSEVAHRIYQRHQLLTNILVAIGIDEEEAMEEACKIEHDISEETYRKLNAYYEKKMKEQ